ncbi:hypothetical protein SISNIDRAFT_424640 [Sistotremastrum niveocremeum HHB9708]|uniref:Uncharacterized protein n=1 Tax=Sistotremastrum niveocremeum HHB9708 TaxID=1314777 RepID=A0A164YL65_9AGAM|nr:hypothetical protein SISNIDRAFT_424640 [Sistotremastrum niveocremeum HHB9708]
MKRGRGRPRGSGAGRPRGRPPGTGRGRGRGRGRGKGKNTLTSRLPGFRRGDGDGIDGLANDDGVPLGSDGPYPKGGAKPYRKIGDKIFIIDNDELITEDDPKGDLKIDSDGNLLGGRQFKAATFTISLRHPTRKYMLAIDAARTSGFKDSLYYFRRNHSMWKLTLTQAEKDALIDEGKLSSHLRTRSVTLVTARSAYKLHGAKMIKDGRWVVDDYREDLVLQDITSRGLKAGDPVGELPDPQPYLQDPLRAAKTGSTVAPSTVGGSTLYKPGGPSTFFGSNGLHPFSSELLGNGNFATSRKATFSRENVTEDNWMFEAAKRTLQANDVLKATRNAARRFHELNHPSKKHAIGVEDESPRKRHKSDFGFSGGVYEPHTATVHYRVDTQPKRSRWEIVRDADGKAEGVRIGGTRAGQGAWGVAVVDTILELDLVETEEEQKRQALLEAYKDYSATPHAMDLG